MGRGGDAKDRKECLRKRSKRMLRDFASTRSPPLPRPPPSPRCRATSASPAVTVKRVQCIHLHPVADLRGGVRLGISARRRGRGLKTRTAAAGFPPAAESRASHTDVSLARQDPRCSSACAAPLVRQESSFLQTNARDCRRATPSFWQTGEVGRGGSPNAPEHCS